MALREPQLKPRNVGSRNQRVIESAKLARVLDPSWRQLVMLGWRWAQSDTWSHAMHMEVQVRSSMLQLGTLWRQLHTKLGPTETQHWEQCSTRSIIDAKKSCEILVQTRCVLTISYWAGHVPILKPCGPQLGARLLPNGSKFGGQVAPSWSQVGPKLEPSGPKLGSWGLVGWSWPQVEPMLRPCRTETVHLNDVGPICKKGKWPQSCAFLGAVNRHPMFRRTRVCCGAALFNNAPPAEAVPDWQMGPFVSRC